MKYLLSYLFGICVKIKYLYILRSIKEVKFCVLENCTNLVGISLPDTLATIPEYCFFKRTSLKKLKWNQEQFQN